MKISIDAEYIGQRNEDYNAFSEKTKATVKRNWLSVSLASDDGDVFVARMFLPDGDIAQSAPLAKRGERVRCVLTGFNMVKGATVATIASCNPIKK